MKRLILKIAVVFLASSVAAGQETKSKRYNGNAYVTYGVGTCQHQVLATGIGGGADGFVWKGLSVGGEIGGFRFRDSNWFGIGTVNGGYHFVNRLEPRKLEPFVNAGVGTAFPGGLGVTAVGGGVNYWLSDRVGLRTEFRAHFLGGEAIAMFRIGASFR